MKISACWIAKNEEKNLPRSIRSVSRLADELIVVDTGSTDGTVESAKSLKATVYPFEWINDFAAARNYALAKATGDVVVFLDADEWFQPALVRKDRQIIEQIFSSNIKINSIIVQRSDIDEETGTVNNIEQNARILRRSSDLFYVGSIHEDLRRKTEKGSALPLAYTYHNWNINHSGYSPGKLIEKAQRNTKLLESAITSYDNSYDQFLIHTYLIREYITSGQPESALTHLQYILDHPEHFDFAYQNLLESLFGVFDNVLILGYLFPQHIKRKQLFNSVVLPANKYYDNTEYKVFDLYYQFLFENHPSRFLKEFSEIMSDIPAAMDIRKNSYLRIVVLIKQHAASLFFSLGEFEKTFDLINDILKIPRYYSPMIFSLLLDCLHGQPDDTVIHYLLNIIDFGYPTAYTALSEALIKAQRKTVFLFLQKRLLDSGRLTKADALYLMLINKNYENIDTQIQSMAMTKLEDQQDQFDEISRLLFLAVVTSNKREIWLRYKDRLTRYERVLASYFSFIPIENPTNDESVILAENYHILAFAADLDTANRLTLAYTADPSLCLSVQAEYYYDNHLDASLYKIYENGISTSNKSGLFFLCRGLIRFGKNADCLYILSELLHIGIFDGQIFELLFIISQKDNATAAKQAKVLYDNYLLVYDNNLDSKNDSNISSPSNNQGGDRLISLDDYRLSIQEKNK